MTARLADNVSSGCAIPDLSDQRSAKANLRCTTDNRVLSESLSCNAASRVDLIFLDDCSLVAWSNILFVGANSTSGIGAKIFDLTNMPALSFNIAQDNSL